ncbi:MAG: 3-hydroxyacyl-CoA dehydrogenase family protein [Bacteroidota bacterium]
MKIGVIGDKVNLSECVSKFTDHEVHLMEINEMARQENNPDLLFHFTIEDNPEDLESLNSLKTPFIFLNTVKVSLAELTYVHGKLASNIYGFNGLPGFFDRPLLEVTSQGKASLLEELFFKLGIDFLEVADRVGMVTPRVVAMIINEAFYTVQEGTATKQDIDLGMKLGTNYPYGPFEWLERIGVSHIYELLEALYEDTKDPRYKICPLLKREYLLLSE